jgi:hypothetical protein
MQKASANWRWSDTEHKNKAAMWSGLSESCQNHVISTLTLSAILKNAAAMQHGRYASTYRQMVGIAAECQIRT